MRLPTPQQLAGLVQLAAHSQPEVRAQASELCRMLPPVVRLLAAARLAEQHAFHAAVACAWPDDPASADQLRRALVRDSADHVHARWLELTGWDPAFRAAMALPEAQRTRARGVRRALEKVVRKHPSPATYALAVVGMAQLEEESAAGLSACIDHLPLASARPEGALPWLAARVVKRLSEQRVLTTDDRRGLAAGFAAALDADDFPRAGVLLTDGCAYTVRGETLYGPEAILASYREATEQAHTRFDAVAYDSRVGEVTGESVVVHFADHLTLRGATHTFRCFQRLWMDDLGRIWRIEHHDLAGEREKLHDFEHGG